MTIDYPMQTTGLRQLWKEAFGDSDAFLDVFFSHGYSPRRCRCITDDGQVAAALYWFDCSFAGKKIAYLYAVATAVSHRGKGLCRKLMADTHALLANQGYAGAILVPGEGSLFDFYAAMGYETISCADTIRCIAGEKPVPVAKLSPETYAARRWQLLPEKGVLQEGENLTFLAEICTLYGGDGWIMAASTEEKALTAMEFLGDCAAIPGILTALGKQEGTFRTPGSAPFAMYLPFDGGAAPTYFGLAFD
ncbi:MAG: GNAT family N-acetyltransferase [Oscillospiraceae bacterium]|nr:GNAT family N-acetyltransferase [Oscillospiraceae bacterium]